MNDKIIEKMLSPYKKESHFLKSFELVENKGIATFMVNSDFYCITGHPVHHFTAVELQVCLNQLLYVYFFHLGLFDNLFNNDNFINTRAEKNFIIEQTTHFKKDIDSSQIIRAKIEVLKSRKIGNVKFMECRFQFGEGCFGTVKSAHKK